MKTKSNMKIAPILNQPDRIVSQMNHNSLVQSRFQKKDNKGGITKQIKDDIKSDSKSLQKQFKFDTVKQKQKSETLVLNTVLVKVQKRESIKNKNRKNQQKCQFIVPNINVIQKKEGQDDRKNHNNNQQIIQIRPRSKNLRKKQFSTSKGSRSMKKRQKNNEKHSLQKKKVWNSQHKQSVCSSSSSPKNQLAYPNIISETNKNKKKETDSPVKDKKSEDEHRVVKKQSFTSTNQILDSRKKSMNLDINRNGSQCKCFENLKIPKERIFSFLLIYQILITFTILFCLIENIYSMLSMIVVLILPTYFGHQCINSRIDSRKLIEQVDPSSQGKIEQIGKYKENLNIQNSYFESLDQEELTQQNYSITSLNIQSKSHNQESKQKQKLNEDSINESNTKSIFPLSKNYSQQMSVTNEKKPKNSSFNYILIVPYLQENQVQNFGKCSKCKSTHINSRIKHCNICNVCHFGYDHYCKWLAVCVDGANYLYFLRFLSSVWCLGIIFNILGLFYLQKISRELEIKKDEVKVIYLIILCFLEIQSVLAFAFSTYVLGYHLWLIKRGVSTRQHFLSQDQGLGRKNNNYCTTSNSTFLKSFFHLLNNTYLLFFIQKFPKLQRRMRQKNSDQSLTKSILMKNQDSLKKEQKINSEQSDQQKTNQFIQQQEHSQEGHCSASEAGSPVKLSFRNFKQ